MLYNVFAEICMESFKDSRKDMIQTFIKMWKTGVVYRGNICFVAC